MNRRERKTMFDCKDCGVNAWELVEDDLIVHEDFYVHDVLWDRACPDDLRAERELPNGAVGDAPKGSGAGFVICIGCFEKRLGRTLTRADFKVKPHDLFDRPPSKRFIDRWEARSMSTVPSAPSGHRCPEVLVDGEWITFCDYRLGFLDELPFSARSPEPVGWRCPQCASGIIRIGVRLAQEGDGPEDLLDLDGGDDDHFLRVDFRCCSQTCGWTEYVLTRVSEGLVAGA